MSQSLSLFLLAVLDKIACELMSDSEKVTRNIISLLLLIACVAQVTIVVLKALQKLAENRANAASPFVAGSTRNECFTIVSVALIQAYITTSPWMTPATVVYNPFVTCPADFIDWGTAVAHGLIYIETAVLLIAAIFPLASLEEWLTISGIFILADFVLVLVGKVPAATTTVYNRLMDLVN